MEENVFQAKPAKMNLQQIVEEIFLVLNQKEKEVMVKRFSLDNKPRWTLEKIGQKFSVTRERIRQIEKIALGKLKRTVKNSKLSLVNEWADELLEKYGAICLEEKLIQEVLRQIDSGEEVDSNIVCLALNINPKIVRTEKNNFFRPFWRFREMSLEKIQEVQKRGMEFLEKSGEVISVEDLVTDIQKAFAENGENLKTETVVGALETDCRIKKVKEGGFGLMSWRHINPKSIRDKAYIVLKKSGSPLHFNEIAARIITLGLDNKKVTIQAVHNELIRSETFVLVGRGLYALKDWGYKRGTVSDIIEGILRKKSPMKKQDIVEAVLKERQVKKGTISLNLQKDEKFVRVGRAMYSLHDE